MTTEHIEQGQDALTERDFLDWVARAEAHLAAKAKPVGALGSLETLACRLAALQRTLRPCVGRTSLLVFGADHGITVARPEVSAFPRSVSAPVFKAVVRGQAASAVLCAANGCSDLLAVDVGLAADVTDAQPPQPSGSDRPGSGVAITVLHRKVRSEGTRNMCEGPAMTEVELETAMRVGAEAVQVAIRGAAGSAPGPGDGTAGAAGASVKGCGEPAADGCDADAADAPAGDVGCGGSGGALPLDWRECVVCLGEVGIGNTTAAAALLAALTGASAEEVCGRGTGVGDAGLAAKRAAVSDALAANAELLETGGALGSLQAVGGLELAAMAGAVLEAARLGVPVIVDGFICGAAALAALAHSPGRVGRVLILSHRSAEKGSTLLLSALVGSRPLLPTATRQQQRKSAAGVSGDMACPGAPGMEIAALEPKGPIWPTPAVFDMGLRLGEGTGAVLMLPMLRSSAAIMCDMASLEEVLAG